MVTVLALLLQHCIWGRRVRKAIKNEPGLRALENSNTTNTSVAVEKPLLSAAL